MNPYKWHPSLTNSHPLLKHRKDDLSLKELGKHLLIEEQYRLENKTNDDTSKVHVMEEKGESSKAGGKKRHFKRECRALKKKQDGGNDNNNKDNNFVAMISQAFSLEEEKSWWVDSGATRNVYNDQTMFKTYEPSYSMLYMGNHSTAQVKGKGKIDLVFTSGNTLTVNDVLHVLDVRKNLVSGSLLNKFGFKLVFKSDKFILSKGGKFVGKGYHTGGMFKLNIKDVVNSSVNDVNMTAISDANDASAGIVTNNDAINKMPTSSYYFDSSLLWHAILGHVYFKRMRNMANANLIPKLNSKNDKCQTCMHTKITRLPFPTIQRSSKILELVHSDVCDLHATPTISGKNYFATFIDDYSRYCYVNLLHSKDECLKTSDEDTAAQYNVKTAKLMLLVYKLLLLARLSRSRSHLGSFLSLQDRDRLYKLSKIYSIGINILEKFKIYKNEVELKCDTRIKCLRTDRGGEYYDPRYFQSTGIVHQVTALYTPQHNGIAERKNRTLMDIVNSMMSHSGLSSGYWGEALLTACYILNRVPSKRSIKTPYELWNRRTPKLDYLRIWGCRAIVRLPESKKRKLRDKGIECIFLGYAQNSKAYRFIVVEPNDLISVNTIIESRDARFDGNRFRTIPKAHEISKETMSTEIPITTAGNNDDSFLNPQQVEPRRSTRQRRQRTFSPDFEMYLVEEDRKGLIRECNTPKMGRNGNDVPRALLHNTIAQVMRERPISVV
ncbi:zinc finger, CCHC-type containing protein [Tanacetum coccineum]